MSKKLNDTPYGDRKMLLDERMYAFFKNPDGNLEAATICKEKAEAGDYNAMLWLARMYRDGKGVRKNISKAIDMYKKSHEKNLLSKFELLVMLSNQKPSFREEDIPEGLKMDSRKKDKLLVYKFNDKSMNLLVKLFPFTHYSVVGFSYEGGYKVGYNEDCNMFDKILIANIYDSARIREDLIFRGVPAEKIITARKYLDKDKFDGDAIVCNFGNETFEKKTWVVVPGPGNGLLWHYNSFKTFKGETLSECDYIIDAQNHFSMLMNIDDIGHYNPWNYYFKPISSKSLKEAYCSHETIISTWMPKEENRVSSCNVLHELSDIMLQKIDVELEKFVGKKRTLGVIVRGTDYVSMQPFGHRIQLDEYEMIEIIDERIKSFGFTHIYLSTEDQGIYETFDKHFGSKLITINQRRFKKQPTLNIDLVDKNVIEPFGKLIQQERYLTATHLIIECKLILMSSGGGAAYVRRNLKGGIIESHTKGNWGLFGDSPLIVCSHNKNHLSITDKCNTEPSAQYLDLKRYTQEELNRGVDLKNIHIFLETGINYVCSFSAKEPKSLSLSLTLSSNTGKSASFELNQNDIFIPPFDSVSGDIILKSDSTCNSNVGIQIEEGVVSSSYEPFRYSMTQICVKDVDGNTFAPGDIEYMDFDKGVFYVQNLKHELDSDELKRYNEIICFDGGYLTYHEGKYHGNKGIISKTTFRETINPRKVVGSPKQLLRFSDFTLARMYRDGKGAEQDLSKAAEWMRKAADKDIELAKEEYFDILWRIDTQESMKTMIEFGEPLAEAGNGELQGRMGRAYRDGRGVERDLDKAIEWMRKAANKNVGWAMNELFDMLWRRGDPKDLVEMKVVAENGAERGNGPCMGRLGRMYLEGKGVEKDFEKAKEQMRRAADLVWWWGLDLSKLLLKSQEKKDHEEAFQICSGLAERGNATASVEAMGYLGRMYRDGRGVERDLDKAIEWMRKACCYDGNEWPNEMIEHIIEKKDIECLINLMGRNNRSIELFFIREVQKRVNIEHMLSIICDLISYLYVYDTAASISKNVIASMNRIMENIHVSEKQEIFNNLPKRDGVMKNIQNSETALLYIFDKICKENNIEYMIAHGTLLGSVRHSGWIPWDDDIDLMMFDDEIEKLRVILLDNPDIELVKRVIPAGHRFFNPFKYYWIRFKKIDIQIYLDISPMIYLKKDINLKECYESYLLDVRKNTDTDEETRTSVNNLNIVESKYDDFLNSIKEGDVINLNKILIIHMNGDMFLFNNKDVMPTKEYNFGEIKVMGPKNANAILEKWYGDYYRLPTLIKKDLHPIFNNLNMNKIKEIDKLYSKYSPI